MLNLIKKKTDHLLPWLLLCIGCSALLLSTTACSQQASAVPSRELPEMICAAIERGDPSVRIPPGRYFVQPEDGTHLLLENIKDFTIEATGVEMVCTETTRAVFIENCVNLKIRGLTIDYDPLPYTQGEIVEISKDRKSHIIKIQEGFPHAETAIVFKHSIYTAERELRFGSYYRMQIEVLPDNHLRIYGLNPAKDGGEQVGDFVVISSESLKGRYHPHAVHLYDSDSTVLENVTLYASPCFGFLEEHSTESVYRKCVIDRRDGRLHSLNADGFHSKFAEVGPRIENCRAMWMGDDGVNICGSYHMVVASDGHSLRVLAKRGLDIEVGDSLQILDEDGHLMPQARVRSIQPVGKLNALDEAALKSVHLLPRVMEFLQDAYRIELDQSMDIGAGSVIASMNRMGNGFSVVESEFGNLRSRGILIKANNGEIRNNRVVNCHIQGIKIAPEYIWLESGASSNLQVTGNTVIGSGAESILIDNIGAETIHKDINITRNKLQSDRFPLIHIRGLDGGRLSNNELLRANGKPAPESAVIIEHSRGIVR